MMQKKSRSVFGILVLFVCTLLACQTTALIGGLTQNNARPTVTLATKKSSATPTSAKPQPTRDPSGDYNFVPATTPRCTIGDNAASIVSGSIVNKGAPVEGQRVQASAGEGGEPISDEPAVSDPNGNYQVTLVCDGQACNGSFWVWLIDADKNQISPFVKFVFDNQCRRGTLNFRNP